MSEVIVSSIIILGALYVYRKNTKNDFNKKKIPFSDTLKNIRKNND